MLHEKLATIRDAFGPVQKTGQNSGVGGGYRFVEANEVASKFVDLLSAHGLTMLPVGGRVIDRYKSISEKQHVVDIEQTWRITDAGSGESIDIMSFGQGADNADKALPKAQTNAMKYAILLALQAAGDDPEREATTDRLEAEGRRQPASRPQVVGEKREDPSAAKPSQPMLKKLMATFDEKGLKDAEKRKAFTAAMTGKASSKDLTVADVEKLFVALADFSGLAS